jgi:hypothetical protein
LVYISSNQHNNRKTHLPCVFFDRNHHRAARRGTPKFIVKLSIALTMIGGVGHAGKSGTQIRPNNHLLLVR